MTIYAQGVEFELVECCACSAPMMMTAHMNKRLRKTKGDFYCVACGQVQGWYGKNKEEKERDQLKRQLDNRDHQLQAETDRRRLAESQEQHAKNQVRAQKAAKTKLKKRIHNGVCPCCTRTFANLQRHMKSQHPSYADGGSQAEVITFKVVRENLGLTQVQVANECRTMPSYVSMYERDKPCPADARASIEKWFNEKTETA